MKYERPLIIQTDGECEGVFASSGTGNESCKVKTWINGSMGPWGGHWKQQCGWSHENLKHPLKGDEIVFTMSIPCTFYDLWGDCEVLEDGGTTIKVIYNGGGIGNCVRDFHFESPTIPSIITFDVTCHNV